MRKDSLGDRMKKYENAYRYYLPERLPVLVRVDGKAFHTYTKGMKKPFDEELAFAMWETAKYLCETIQGCQVAYTQSDEITLLLTNYHKLTTQSYYDNSKTKIETSAASKATKRFNQIMSQKYPDKDWAEFDARAWVLPHDEVVNNFIWRQNDASRNSVSMVAQANFPHKQLQGLNSQQLKDKLFLEKQISWNELPVWQKRGACIINQEIEKLLDNGEKTKRYIWQVDFDTPIFTQSREYIEQYVYVRNEE